ncbi:hypothetical protein BJ165DRAFT_416775 [Panaeolus papilionaceus]|nr:hypothetical protein BJ165DRAFT_416775 [Panaeolus papilionaceus]
MSTSGKYKWIRINGPISVEPTTMGELEGKNVMVIVLMGPTGSGKSAFIESLSPNQELSISKDTLESVTQDVTCYTIANLSDTHGFYYILMDTPGFLDTKLSESRITRMITEKLDEMRQAAGTVYVSIFYFQPITDIRMGGSKRDAVMLLRAFADSFEAIDISVVTTMWNMISTHKQIEDANARLSALKQDIFKKSDKTGIDVTKFEFTRKSALSVLDTPWYGWGPSVGGSETMDLGYKSLVRDNLLTRIDNVQQRLQALAKDKKDATIPGLEDPLLLEVMRREEVAALAALHSFLDDLYDIDPQSCSSPYPRPMPISSPRSASPLIPSPSNKSLRGSLKDLASTLIQVRKWKK